MNRSSFSGRARAPGEVVVSEFWSGSSAISESPAHAVQGGPGRVVGAQDGQGRVSAASRADYAEAAAVVLSTEGHLGAACELGGGEACTLAELAAAISAAAGKQVTCTDLPALA